MSAEWKIRSFKEEKPQWAAGSEHKVKSSCIGKVLGDFRGLKIGFLQEGPVKAS